MVCGISRNHRWIIKQVSAIDSPAMEWYLHVLMARSTAFTRWICGGTNWYSIYFCLFYFLRPDNDSLSSQWNHGMYPILVRCYTCLVYDSSIWLPDLLLRGAARISFAPYTYIISIYIFPPDWTLLEILPSIQCRYCESRPLWPSRSLYFSYLVLVLYMCESILLHWSYWLLLNKDFFCSIRDGPWLWSQP